MSVVGVRLDGVEVTAELVARVPAKHLRVPRAEFGAVWSLAERLAGGPGRAHGYVIGVARTCRWFADQPVPSSAPGGRWEQPRTPFTHRLEPVMPETVEDEYLAAATAPRAKREWARGVIATLDWAWRRGERPPLDVSQAAVG